MEVLQKLLSFTIYAIIIVLVLPSVGSLEQANTTANSTINNGYINQVYIRFRFLFLLILFKYHRANETYF